MKDIEYFNYYLQRGDTGVAWGYQAWITELNPDGSIKNRRHVAIDHELKAHPNDPVLKALRARAVAAIHKCVEGHGRYHTVRKDGGSNRPVQYDVFCDPWKGGCGNAYSTCDPNGRTDPWPCPVGGPATPPGYPSYPAYPGYPTPPKPPAYPSYPAYPGYPAHP